MTYEISGEEPLEEVMAEVERVYGVRLKVGGDDGGGDDADRVKQDRT